MGFSVAVASAILFSAAIVFSMVLYDTLDSSFQKLQGAQKERDAFIEQRSNTRIRITDASFHQRTLFINATNEGSSVILVKDGDIFLLDILINGSLSTDDIVYHQIQGKDTSLWCPGEELCLVLGDVSVGDNTRIVLITPEGERAEYTFFNPPSAHYRIIGMKSPYVLDEDRVYIFEALSSGMEGMEYLWGFDDGSSGYGERVGHLFHSPGVYYPNLGIKDRYGRTDQFEARVEVRDITPPEAGILAEGVVDEDTQIEIRSYSHDNAGVVNWSWDLGDGHIGHGPTVEHTYVKPGYYSISLSVKDGAGNEFTTQTRIMVRDRTPPEAEAGENFSAMVNKTAYFNASASYDPEGGKIISYTWDFGDGHLGSGEYANHAYTSAGNYTVRLDIMDLSGNTSQDGLTVEVKADSGRDGDT